MALIEIEHFFICPYCWESISMVLDLSAGAQKYIEDCEVCCRPVQLSFVPEMDELGHFEAEAIEQ